MVADGVALETETLSPNAPQERISSLSYALEHTFDMHEDDAQAIAQVVAEVFGRASEVDDDTLDPEVRSIFYTLEAKKLLTFRRETYQSENGQTLRAYYWRVRDDEIKRVADAASEDQQEPGIYDQLPQDAWARSNT